MVGRLFKTVFPNGLPNDAPGSRAPSRQPSMTNLAVPMSREANLSLPATPDTATRPTGFFGRWGSSRLAPSAPASPVASVFGGEDGPLEDLILSGTAFGALPAPARVLV
jgi:hypothetical protein